MKALRYVIGFLLVCLACWLNAEIRGWQLVQTFVVSPATAYAINIVGLSLLILGAGVCFGCGFERGSLSAKAMGLVFLLLLAVQLGFSLLGGAIVSETLARLSTPIVNMNLVTYLAAFLTGLCLGSRKVL